MQTRILRFVITTVLLTGCSSGPPATITWEEAVKPDSIKGKRIILEGYPGVSSIETYSHKGYQQCCLFDTPAGISSSAQRSITLVPGAGTGPNQVEPLPSQYKASDLKVHCSDGTIATFKDKIRVQGKAEVPYGGLYIERIESITKIP